MKFSPEAQTKKQNQPFKAWKLMHNVNIRTLGMSIHGWGTEHEFSKN